MAREKACIDQSLSEEKLLSKVKKVQKDEEKEGDGKPQRKK